MEVSRVSPELKSEQARLVTEIDKAFSGVSREGGVSWSESVIIDEYGSDAKRTAARACDKDTSWNELVDDEGWDASTGVGGWSFLDSIGFRYYLPAGMLRELSGDALDGFPFQLTLGRVFLRDYTLGQWSLLNERQKKCVGDFIRFQARRYEEEGHDYSSKQWLKAYRSYWIQYS